jgi:hypothetical protein
MPSDIAPLSDILRNSLLWSGAVSWVIAQGTKMLCGMVHTRRFDFGYMVSTGGMPSAHSAFTSGLATAAGLVQGWASPTFAIAAAFALVTMFDASTVRRAAGEQARLLNQILDELFKEHHLSEQKLAELLGHTRIEVFMGLLIGVLSAMLTVSLAMLM